MSPASLPDVRVVHLDGPALRALAAGDAAAASALSPVPLGAGFDCAQWRPVWAVRARQVEADPAAAAWVTGVVWDAGRGLAVGRAGFHGPPEADGSVEVGYAVLPEHRRRGYGTAALASLLERAAREPGVRTVRASVSPGNTASEALVARFGFVRVGEQVDEVDGLELVYEVAAGAGTGGPGGRGVSAPGG